MQPEFDVLIVGSGPAGSSAAILLARAGWSVALVEKQRFPRRKVCGECIAASNLPLLHALGIGPAFDAAAGPELRRVALMCGEDAVETDLPAADHELHSWGRALGRETLDVLLLDQARVSGAVVPQPWSMQSMRGGAGHWRCELRALESQATRTLHARLAIDAHGSWETLHSDRSRVRLPRRAGDLFAFKANFRQASFRQGLLPVLCLDGGYGGMVLADGGLCTLACCVRIDRLDALRRASPGVRAGEVVEAWLRRECAGVREALHSATRDGPWLAAGPIAPGVRLRAGDKVYRIGNAAGEAHPIIGEGMSMALQSAWLLCSRLLAADPGAALGDLTGQRGVGRAYAASWRRQFASRLRLATAMAHLAMRPGLAVPLLSLARSWPRLLTLGATWGGKVKCAVDPTALALPTAYAPTAHRADLVIPSQAAAAFATRPRRA